MHVLAHEIRIAAQLGAGRGAAREGEHIVRAKVVQHVTQRFVHAFDKRGKGLRIFGLARLRVVRGEAWIRLKRRMHGVFVFGVPKEFYVRFYFL